MGTWAYGLGRYRPHVNHEGMLNKGSQLRQNSSDNCCPNRHPSHDKHEGMLNTRSQLRQSSHVPRPKEIGGCWRGLHRTSPTGLVPHRTPKANSRSILATSSSASFPSSLSSITSPWTTSASSTSSSVVATSVVACWLVCREM